MTDIQESWAEKEAANYALKHAGGDEKVRLAVLAGIKLVAWAIANDIDYCVQYHHVSEDAWSAFDHVAEWLTSKTNIDTEGMLLYCDKV